MPTRINEGKNYFYALQAFVKKESNEFSSDFEHSGKLSFAICQTVLVNLVHTYSPSHATPGRSAIVCIKGLCQCVQ